MHRANGSVSEQRPVFSKVAGFVRTPIFLIFIAGVAIRLILAPLLTMGYDVYHWALVISNFQADAGLYELPGYYYTPVWGYIMGFISVVQDMFMNIPVFGERFTEAFSIEIGGNTRATATITTVGFNVACKIILFVADILVGYLIYTTIKDHLKDEKKATYAFALWFLCPVVIVVSAVGGMFDAFSVLFLLAAVMLVFRSQYLMGGAMFCLAVFTKFFPAFFFPFLIAYIVMRHRDGTAVKHVAQAAVGFGIVAAIMYIPLVLDGTAMDSLSFLTGRLDGGMGLGLGAIEVYGTVAAYVMILIMSILIAWKYYQKGDTSLETSMRYMLMIAAVTMLYPPAPQYTLIMMPFLIFCMLTTDKDLKRSWILLSVFVTASALTSNFTLMLSAGAYTDLIALDAVVSLIDQYRTAMVFGLNVESIIYYFLGVMQYISILSVLYFMFKGDISKYMQRRNAQAMKE